MTQKMGQSKTFISLDVKVEEIIEGILEDGGIPSNDIASNHYYVHHKEDDEDSHHSSDGAPPTAGLSSALSTAEPPSAIQPSSAAQPNSQLNDLLKRPQTSTKEERLVLNLLLIIVNLKF